MSGTRTVTEIIRDRCLFSYARSGGPGGQNVNKVATKVVARLPLDALDFLGAQRRRLVENRLAARITGGELVVTVQDTREQVRNRQIAVERLAALIRESSVPPKRRVKTRPSLGAREARLRSKKLRASQKRLRGCRDEE